MSRFSFIVTHRPKRALVSFASRLVIYPLGDESPNRDDESALPKVVEFRSTVTARGALKIPTQTSEPSQMRAYCIGRRDTLVASAYGEVGPEVTEVGMPLRSRSNLPPLNRGPRSKFLAEPEPQPEPRKKFKKGRFTRLFSCFGTE